MNKMTTATRLGLGTFFFRPGGGPENWPQIALATERFRAIDLSCRACVRCVRCWVLGAGLGFPVAVSATLRFPPPTSELHVAGETLPTRQANPSAGANGAD